MSPGVRKSKQVGPGSQTRLQEARMVLSVPQRRPPHLTTAAQDVCQNKTKNPQPFVKYLVLIISSFAHKHAIGYPAFQIQISVRTKKLHAIDSRFTGDPALRHQEKHKSVQQNLVFPPETSVVSL